MWKQPDGGYSKRQHRQRQIQKAKKDVRDFTPRLSKAYESDVDMDAMTQRVRDIEDELKSESQAAEATAEEVPEDDGAEFSRSAAPDAPTRLVLTLSRKSLTGSLVLEGFPVASGFIPWLPRLIFRQTSRRRPPRKGYRSGGRRPSGTGYLSGGRSAPQCCEG